MAAILKVENIIKTFPGVKALNSVSLEFDKGEVHALLGENGAGKTTLMRVVCGIYRQDSGDIYFDGEKVDFHNSKQSQEKGISIIHQELNMPVNLTIAEYLFLGRTPVNKLGIVKRKYQIEQSKELLKAVEITRNPATVINELTVAEQQLVEIARSLSMNSKLIIMDEPTSALNQKETQNLFKIIRGLKEKNVTVIYISHKLDEIFEITDRLTVMRDGCVISTHQTKEITHEKVVQLMTGKDLSENYFAKGDGADQERDKNEKPLFSVKNVASQARNLNGVSFDLYKGEVLGIAGLMGAGRTELFRAIFGFDAMTQGEMYLNDRKLDIKSTSDAVKEGIMLLPEDRKVEGLILQMTIGDNITVPTIRKFAKFGVISQKERNKESKEYAAKMNVKCTGIHQVVGNLSGGNQQKVIFARWLSAHPKVLLLDDPTRGIDVGSKHEIYTLIRDLAEQGIGVIFVSSEMPELVGVCDRILVMRDGLIVADVSKSEIDENNLMLYATGKH